MIKTNISSVIRDITADVEEKLSKDSVKRVSGAIVTELMSNPPEGTPRDTLRATNGWNIADGTSPDFSEGGPGTYDEPDPEGEIAKLPEDTERATIANGVHYIGKLEFGSSKQAPTNYVRKAIIVALKSVDVGSRGKAGYGGSRMERR